MRQCDTWFHFLCKLAQDVDPHLKERDSQLHHLQRTTHLRTALRSQTQQSTGPINLLATAATACLKERRPDYHQLYQYDQLYQCNQHSQNYQWSSLEHSSSLVARETEMASPAALSLGRRDSRKQYQRAKPENQKDDSTRPKDSPRSTEDKISLQRFSQSYRRIDCCEKDGS
jgi:hypothetical protein